MKFTVRSAILAGLIGVVLSGVSPERLSPAKRQRFPRLPQWGAMWAGPRKTGSTGECARRVRMLPHNGNPNGPTTLRRR